MKNRSWGDRLLRALIFSLLAFGISVPIVNSLSRVPIPRSGAEYGCVRNLKLLGLAMMQYNQDYGKGPLVESRDSSSGWPEALLPYARSRDFFQCPEQGVNSSSVPPTALGYTDYWINARFSAYNMSLLHNPGRCYLMGDGNDGNDVTRARYAIPGLPAHWQNDPASPLYRHRGRGTILFADGHTRLMSPAQLVQPGAGTF